MKAAVLIKQNFIECQEVDRPRPKAGEALVEVAYCGVCGSDVPRVLQGTAHSYPIILGHEFSGKVVEVGQGVPTSLLGVRVAGIPLVPCMECDDCKQGNYSLCGRYSFIGSRRPGAFAQYVAVPASNVFSIGKNITMRQACFFEPATVAAHAIRLAEFESGHSAVVVGAGTIGIFLAQLLKKKGASRVVALGRRPEKLAIAQAAGVSETLSTAEEGWQEMLFQQQCAKKFDYVFDTSGNGRIMADAFALAANKGKICFVGTPKSDVSFTPRQWEWINRKELHVTGSWMSYSAPWPGVEWYEVSEAFALGDLRLVPEMIDTEVSFDCLNEAFSRFGEEGTVLGKVIVGINANI